MSRIFVAGAAGNIGTTLLAALKAKGLDAVAGTRAGGRTPEGWDGEVRPFDFGDRASMVEAMAGCGKLFLATPLVQSMTRFGNTAVEAAKEAGIEYIVRSSRYGASSDAHWRLGREQGMIDQFVEDSSITFTVLRPNTFMQVFSTVMADAVRTGTLALPEENYAVSYIDVRDVADCAAALLTNNTGHENRFYALTGPEGLTGTDVAARLAAATGNDVAYTPIEEDDFIRGLDGSGLDEWTRNMHISLSRVIKLGMMGNVTKAVEFLTGTPARSFDAFASQHVPVWT
eukprot:TRINITY_DN16362_c0_g1_i1.p5 TRINITY_DN16362_c0_g1~~TRINITY_DN16362_c0_g1_i1.p5  ORF type:complete len:286 (-),score=136.25 TRINITY_DN16362_c0_g1_i1:1579-2436(-)